MPTKVLAKKDYSAVILTVFAFAISVYAMWWMNQNENAVEPLIISWGVWAPVLTIFLYGVLSLTPIPSDPLSLLTVSLFGPVTGIFTSWMGNNFAALVEYIAGKGVSQISDFNKQKNKLPWGLDKLPVNSVWFLIGGRFVPGFGGKIVSILAGVYEVGVWKYLWTAAVANIVGSFMFAAGGLGIDSLFN